MRTDKESERPGGRSVRIVQITDPHLFANPRAKLVGLNCQESFEEVINLIQQQQQDIDCILCTGDIAQDASIPGYQRFNASVSSFGVPHLWIPGNHDIMKNIQAALEGNVDCLEKTISIEGWLIIMLDSSVEGQIYGKLAVEELEFLDEKLSASDEAEQQVMICVHHNPVPVKAQWLQNHSLKNSDEFFAIVDKYEHVKCILWGHIHHEYDGVRKGVRLLASPSTCIQFHPENNHFTLDNLPPGYRWLELKEDGHVNTGVERVTKKIFEVDFSSTGY